jgi:hypothetical protein
LYETGVLNEAGSGDALVAVRMQTEAARDYDFGVNVAVISRSGGPL